RLRTTHQVCRGLRRTDAVAQQSLAGKTHCLALASQGRRRPVRTGPQAGCGTDRRCRYAPVGPARRCRYRNARTARDPARSWQRPLATAGPDPDPPLQRPHGSSRSPRTWLRFRGQDVSLAQRRGQDGHRLTLLRTFLLWTHPEGGEAMTNTRKMKATSTSPLRCAIYTRKSTEEGLDQDFNSLD